MDEVIIKTIKVNCLSSYNELSPTICIEKENNFFPKGLYFNIFYKNVEDCYEAYEEVKQLKNNFEKDFNNSNKNKSYYEAFKSLLIENYKKYGDRICKFKNIEKQTSLQNDSNLQKSQTQNNDFLILVSEKRDGNSIFRSFIKSYFLKLIDESKLNEFIQFLNHIRNDQIAYKIKKYNKEIDLVQKITLTFSELIQDVNLLSFSYALFYLFCGFYPNFEIALIKIVREFVYKFCKYNAGIPLNDSKITIKNEYTIGDKLIPYQKYIKNYIRNYGIEVEKNDFIFKIICLIFQINIRIIDSRIQKKINFEKIFYHSKTNIFNISKLSIPLIKDKEIVIYQDNEYY